MKTLVFKLLWLPAVLACITLLLILLNIAVGDTPISMGEIMKIMFGRGDAEASYVIWQYRMPRLLLALLVGASLAVSGVIVQAVMRNPLAAPDTLGITGGAGLAAVAITLLMPLSAPLVLTISAFIGGLAAAAAVYMLAYRTGIIPVRLMLVGIAISAFCASAVQLLVTRGFPNVSSALIWLSGSLWGRSWEQVSHLLPWVVILVPLAWILSIRMDIIRIGDLIGKGLGLRIEANRLLLLSIAIFLAGAAVSAVGTIGFVGLITPHLARRLVGARHRVLIPVAALLGGQLVLLADLLGRAIKPPLEIPAGLIVAMIGGPYFLFLLWKQSRLTS
ncbi:iron-dicitrate transporter subunit FecD [Paenibacillus sp. BIHB 4019]|uniref:Iron-dicitrate transporter subunit FecD n=1 Tax=Paenibacillus sp. BIHB 4019 TaxID=1870819 RepID=A0A1B2DK77_9BACL|nr:iron chelate uptake ABC transporter family permease subunit [Paenibacillus sp. BIHB 4019]ANY68113.1 iron-dicitrate transporter subunit FecD [Paenibacillus sp. BIHB 4019]